MPRTLAEALPHAEFTEHHDLVAFDRPDWLRMGMDFTLHPLPGDRTRLATSTLCEPTDDDARWPGGPGDTRAGAEGVSATATPSRVSATPGAALTG